MLTLRLRQGDRQGDAYPIAFELDEPDFAPQTAAATVTPGLDAQDWFFRELFERAYPTDGNQQSPPAWAALVARDHAGLRGRGHLRHAATRGMRPGREDQWSLVMDYPECCRR